MSYKDVKNILLNEKSKRVKGMEHWMKDDLVLI